MERRKHPRFRTKFDVLCSTGESEGAGTLLAISRSGAQIASNNALPEIGTKIRLYIFIQPVCPFELAGEVVRVEDQVIAIRYSNLDPEVGRLVDDVAAIVG